MGRSGVPDRWLNYSPMGSVVPETRFVACKVPLKDGLLRSVPQNERFGPNHLMEAYPKLGLLVDLTNTTRYYSKEEFTKKQIKYEKIFCPGQVIPPNSIVKRFFEAVDQFFEESKGCETLIVVHCTHGVNRTGYFICRYMIEKLNIPPEKAVERFQQARGHNIERAPYVNDLKNGCKGGSEADLKPRFSHNLQIKQGIEKRKRERETVNNHRKTRMTDSSQADCTNFYNWRARNCLSDQYCDDFNKKPSEYKNLKDLRGRKNECYDTNLETQDDFKSPPHILRFPNFQYKGNNLKAHSYPNEYPKPLISLQKQKKLTDNCQPIKTDRELINSKPDYYKVKQSDYFHDKSYRYTPNSQIRRDITGLQISEPSDMPSHSAGRRRNRNSRGQGIRQRDHLPFGSQSSQLKNPIENCSVFDASKVPQNANCALRPNTPQPYYPINYTFGVPYSNSFVPQPRSHFPNRVWRSHKKPATDLNQQPQNSFVQ